MVASKRSFVSSSLNILKQIYRMISDTSCLDRRKSKPCLSIFKPNIRGRRFSEQSIRLMLHKYTRNAGIKRNITPHMFRHSFATYLIEEGVDVSCVQQILGHTSIKTTQIYIHIAAQKQAEILKEFHPRKKMKIPGRAA